MKYFTKLQINEMIKNKRIILLVRNSVYDVTDFEHPFNIDPFLIRIGKDVREDYFFHSNKSKKIWEKYKIGKLKNEMCIII
tara:strand:- start:2492 stop:2734 length:243 start_codon:yes stop_codon:yes gene_type:complete